MYILRNGADSVTKQAGIADQFLSEKSKLQKAEILCAFAAAIFTGITLEKLQRKYCLESQSGTQSDMFVRTSGLMDLAIQELMSPEPQRSNSQES